MTEVEQTELYFFRTAVNDALNEIETHAEGGGKWSNEPEFHVALECAQIVRDHIAMVKPPKNSYEPIDNINTSED